MNIRLPWKPRVSLCLPTYLGSHCLIKLTEMKSLHKMCVGGRWSHQHCPPCTLWLCFGDDVVVKLTVRVYREKAVGSSEEWIPLALTNFLLNFLKKLVISSSKYITNTELICLKHGVNLFRILGNEADGIKINNSVQVYTRVAAIRDTGASPVQASLHPHSSWNNSGRLASGALNDQHFSPS